MVKPLLNSPFFPFSIIKMDPLHGVTLERIVTDLQEEFGFAELGKMIPINCFLNEPSVKSSLKFLRKTPWARDKVESLYLFMLREIKRQQASEP